MLTGTAPAPCAGATYTICVGVTLTMFPAGIAAPSTSTCVFAAVPKPARVRVPLCPPAAPRGGGLTGGGVGVFVGLTVALAAPAALAATVYAPASPFAVAVALACPLPLTV